MEKTARIKLNEMLSLKGKKKSWVVCKIHKEHIHKKWHTVYTFKSEPEISYKIQVTV